MSRYRQVFIHSTCRYFEMARSRSGAAAILESPKFTHNTLLGCSPALLKLFYSTFHLSSSSANRAACNLYGADIYQNPNPRNARKTSYLQQRVVTVTATESVPRYVFARHVAAQVWRTRLHNQRLQVKRLTGSQDGILHLGITKIESQRH